MRTIDRFAGIPLCWITGMWSSLLRQKQSTPPEKWRSVLIIKFFGLGSVLLSSPFVAALHQYLPNARIIYLTFGANGEMLERMPHLSVQLTISTSSIRSFVRDTWKAWRAIRKASVDAVFDLEFFSKFSTFASFLSGAPVRVGYALPARWRRMNVTIPVHFRHNRHVTEVFLSQLEAVGLATYPPPPLMPLRPSFSETTAMVQALDLGADGLEIIAVNINAGPTSHERRWPPDRFISLCRHLLSERPALRFIFTGSTEERAYIEEALRHDNKVRSHSVNGAGLLSLGGLIALLEQSSLLLTNDSGPMHIASSMGKPVVALFGPESPTFYGPSSGSTRTIYKSLACSPCLNVYNAKLFVCPYKARCMKEISTTEVLAAVRSVRPVPTT